MLKYRLLTAAILIPLFVWLVIALSPTLFCLLTSIIVLWGAWEWSYFMGIKKFSQSLIYPCCMLLGLYLTTLIPPYFLSVILTGCIWWLLAAVLVSQYPKSTHFWSNNLILRGLMGMLTLIPCWLAVNLIRNAGALGIELLLFLFILIWGADSGAYFAGRRWGKHKLAPSVSPGKTWEGLAGALCVTLLIAGAAGWLMHMPATLWGLMILVAIITVMFSVLGDLFESMLKRNVGLKDSGRVLPGHGGVLDRIDSLTAAAPVFLIGIELLEKLSG